MRARNLAQLRPIGVIRSTLKSRSEAPKQGAEGAPDAGLEIKRFAVQALDGIKTGQDLIVLTWFHQARRDVLEVHPRSDPQRRLTGVFATRSPDRPNPNWAASRYRAQYREKPVAHRPDRSYRRHSRHRHQTRS